MSTTCQIRKERIAQRKSLTEGEARSLSEQIALNLASFKGFQKAKHIAYYLPVSGEADPTILCVGLSTEPSEALERKFYLPVLHKDKKNELHFVRTDIRSKFTSNKYGISEPEYLASDVIKANKLDLVIMPLVSFDRGGNRIGMGGGYYDRTFAFKQNSSKQSSNEERTQGRNREKPLLIGFAYEFQYSDNIKPEDWDVKLDGVVTESGFFQC